MLTGASMRFCELCEKEVINVSDCRSLGNVIDLDIDENCGKICALIVAEPGKPLCFFCPACEYLVPWNKVIRIGPDIVLVDVCTKDAKRKG